MYNLFGVLLDMGRYIPLLWKINIPTSLQETLWQEINGSQPLDAPAWWEWRVSFNCACGARVSLDHILTGCGSYDLYPLQEVLWEKLWLISPLSQSAPCTQMSSIPPPGIPYWPWGGWKKAL